MFFFQQYIEKPGVSRGKTIEAIFLGMWGEGEKRWGEAGTGVLNQQFKLFVTSSNLSYGENVMTYITIYRDILQINNFYSSTKKKKHMLDVG